MISTSVARLMSFRASALSSVLSSSISFFVDLEPFAFFNFFFLASTHLSTCHTPPHTHTTHAPPHTHTYTQIC
jgi:hypothetical protein